MKPMMYRTLWFLEVVLVVILVFVLTVPVQDYALREFKEYWRHPSPQTLQAFRDKTEEESQLRHEIAIPIAAVVLTVAILLYRKRHRSPKAP
jgi:hypothetical protein